MTNPESPADGEFDFGHLLESTRYVGIEDAAVRDPVDPATQPEPESPAANPADSPVGFCQNCGHPRLAIHVFCERCGTRLEDVPPRAPIAAPPPAGPPVAPAPDPASTTQVFSEPPIEPPPPTDTPVGTAPTVIDALDTGSVPTGAAPDLISAVPGVGDATSIAPPATSGPPEAAAPPTAPPPTPAPVVGPPVETPPDTDQPPSTTDEPAVSSPPEPPTPPGPDRDADTRAAGIDEIDEIADDSDDDGETVSIAALRAARAAEAVAAGPTVQAVHCPNGHPNPPHFDRCRSCDVPIGDHSVTIIARVALGSLVFDDGRTEIVDAPLVIGRKPRADQTVSDEPARAVPLPDPDKLLSRVHAEVLIADWQVQVFDRESMNHTYLELPGQSPFQLRPGEPYPIPPGTRITFGDVISCRYVVDVQ